MSGYFALLTLSALTLAACSPQPKSSSSRPQACSDEEWRSRQAKTAACASEFRALVDKANADAEQNSVVSHAPPPPLRDSF